jgi:formylglycine-generating enzyme required for sulfatase activity
MIGNIYEWCLDKEVSAANLPGGTDPLYDSSTSNKHVIRGGSWNYNINYNTSFYRNLYNANYEANGDNKGFGFRLCIYLERNDGGTL